MSNENLSLQEVSDIVGDINGELGEPWWDRGHNLSVCTNGWVILVELGNLHLWDSDDDTREYVYDDSGGVIITDEGYEMRESLRSYLVKELKFIGNKLLELED